MLTRAWFPLDYHPKQSAAWRTRARFVALACGRGSGKTELARRRLVRFLPVKKPWADPIYFMALPTRDQARRVAWEKIKALIPPHWIVKDGVRESDLTIQTKFGSKLYLVGMDNPARVEGVQWDGGVIDESCDQRPGAFDRAIRPALSHRSAWCWRIGVPKRWGPGASEFKKAWEDWGSGTLGDQYESYTWPSADILKKEEIQDAARSLDAKDFDEQYGAIWQGTSGMVFYSFDDKLNVIDPQYCKYDPSRPLLVGSDFNVDPMAWVVCQASDKSGKKLNVIDEIWMRNTNTPAALDELNKRFNKPESHQSGWAFFGDASSKARKTSSTQSDLAHIANDRRFVRSMIHYPRTNPGVHERFSATNAAFCNALGDRRLYVSSRCKWLQHDLTTRSYLPGSREVDDHDDIGHITDALGYIIHRVWPIVPTSDVVPSVLVGAA